MAKVLPTNNLIEFEGREELAPQMNWVRLLWNDAPGRVEAVLVLFNVKFPVGVEVS